MYHSLHCNYFNFLEIKIYQLYNKTMTRRNFDILKWCANVKTCDTNVQYTKKVTGGNDPTITKAMRYAQYVRNSRPHQNASGNH